MKCGGSERFTVSGHCVACYKQWRQDHGKWSKKQVEQKVGAQARRAEAVAAGQKTYHGSPCRVCKAVEKYVVNQSCVSCITKRSRGNLDDPKLMAPYRTPEKKNKKTKQWRKKNPDIMKVSYRRSHLKKYQLTEADYQQMTDVQRGVCKICKTPPTKRRLSVDHDHDSGSVRGLLCHKCNFGLGFFRDDPKLLKAAIRYLGGR